MTTARAVWLHNITPLHVGSGRGVGFIDLPIMREKVTGWPFIPGSAFKGVLTDKSDATPDARQDDNHKNKDKIRSAFGVADGDDPSKQIGNAGSLVLSDMHLVCLPVRSIYGTFAWCTSPLALQRLERDLKQIGTQGVPAVPKDFKAENLIRVTSTTVLDDGKGEIYFEDLDFKADQLVANTKAHPEAEAWSQFLGAAVFPGQTDWQAAFKSRFAIVPNSVFDFLCEMGTEVVARIRIKDDTKIVEEGALWYEESLPAESILSGFVWCDKVYGPKGVPNPALTPQVLLDAFCPVGKERVWQFGGKESVGRGRVRCLFQ